MIEHRACDAIVPLSDTSRPVALSHRCDSMRHMRDRVERACRTAFHAPAPRVWVNLCIRPSLSDDTCLPGPVSLRQVCVHFRAKFRGCNRTGQPAESGEARYRQRMRMGASSAWQGAIRRPHVKGRRHQEARRSMRGMSALPPAYEARPHSDHWDLAQAALFPLYELRGRAHR